jgi:GxxExxY protein
MADIIYKDESYAIMGKCMEVHNQLGSGFLEIVYKDALELKFTTNNIHYEREKMYDVFYKGQKLAHNFYADFVVYDKIILEVKAVREITNEHRAQALNYLTISGCKLALIINFGKGYLTSNRVVL